MSYGAVWQWGVRATLYINLPSVVFLPTFFCQIKAIQGQQTFKLALTTRKLICEGSWILDLRSKRIR